MQKALHQMTALLLLTCSGLTAHAQQRAATGHALQPTANVTESTTTETLPPAWTQFTSVEGKFAVQLPSAPQKQQETADTPMGPMQINLFTAASENGVYVVGYADAEFLAKLPADNAEVVTQVLQGTGNGLATSLKGTIAEQSELQTSGYTGRQFKLTLPDDMRATVRVFLVKGRIYQMILLHHQSKSGAAEFGLFFPSFRVLS